MDIKICCKNCDYHIYEDIDKGYVCCNDESDCLAEWTEDDFCCKYFKPKNIKKDD
mgnify:FL=1|jgi:hypothetical protein